MKIEVTIERQRGKVWAQYAKGRFAGDPDQVGEDLERWMKQKGIPDSPSKAAGWGVTIRCTA